MASYRYRAKIPAEQIGAIINSTEADVFVFAKPMAEDCVLIGQLKAKGAKVVVDFCDDHFMSHGFYRTMAEAADLITCPSKAMQETIKAHGFDSVVIGDPYEYWGEPHAQGDNLLWFGHQSNIDEVVPYIKAGYRMEVVTGENKRLQGYTPWSVENLGQAMSRANIVIIPDGKPTRSNNRLVNAIASGCFVVAGDQHREQRNFIWANRKIASGVQFARCFKDELNDMVKEGQQWVKANYSPEVIGQQWKQALASI